MNKSSIRQKRSLGKDSPLSKRPKLDFTTVTKESPKSDKYQSKESPKGCNTTAKEKISVNFFGKNKEENQPTASDWDDDFSGDMLEKVCLIADLSQAMVNNQSVPTEFDKEEINLEIFESNKIGIKPKTPPLQLDNDLKRMKLEMENLKEKLKTKEGEVHILRSQLKQSEDAKQTVALQNIKVLEELQKKCSEKICATEKELESTKSKLLFRDLEYKTLSERCRQLEYNLSKNKLNESSNLVKPISMSQTTHQKLQSKEICENDQSTPTDKAEGYVCRYEFPTQLLHEGKYLMRIICPELFKFLSETSIVPFYSSHNRNNDQRAGVDFGKTENYKWSILPEQKIFIKDLHNSVSSLFTFSSFSHINARKIVQNIFEHCCEILEHQKKILLFLEDLQLYSEYDEADHSLLENEDEIKLVTIKILIDGVKLNKEECGIEGRRSLALINSLMMASEVVFDLIRSNLSFMELLKSLSSAIGTLRRPLRYSGILIGITLILQKVLEEKNLTTELLATLNQVVKEIIFSRPKLDVLREVVEALAAGKHHVDFMASLCTIESVDSCTLYMDCKLKQAMFFTENACPLKLLCMQIMSQVCLPSSKPIRWEITESVIKWLNDSMNTVNFKKIKWLPINCLLIQEERCFNVTECLLYLLTLCLKDYNAEYVYQDQDEAVSSGRNDIEKKKIKCISVIAQGAVLLKRILKVDSRQLHSNIYLLRFAMSLKAFFPSKSDFYHKTHINHMTSLQREAMSWIIDLVESDFGSIECYLKQNTSAMPDTELFNALKINDNLKIL